MMGEMLPNDFKIFIYDLPNLPIDILGDAAIYCPNQTSLQQSLMDYHLSDKYIACNSDQIIGLDVLLLNYPIETLFVVNKEKHNDISDWFGGLILNKMTEVEDEIQLMRHLCTSAVVCYQKQSIEHKTKGNHGLANRCIVDSIKALDHFIRFI